MVKTCNAFKKRDELEKLDPREIVVKHTLKDFEISEDLETAMGVVQTNLNLVDITRGFNTALKKLSEFPKRRMDYSRLCLMWQRDTKKQLEKRFYNTLRRVYQHPDPH